MAICRLSSLPELRWRALDCLSSAAERAMKIALAPFGKVTLEVLLERDLAIPVKPILARIPLAISRPRRPIWIALHCCTRTIPICTWEMSHPHNRTPAFRSSSLGRASNTETGCDVERSVFWHSLETKLPTSIGYACRGRRRSRGIRSIYRPRRSTRPMR
jgi:hypothetical protein